ncbi:MAG TPA: hypothetical protein PK231_08795 [Acidocella sp.]|jgi:hypothetical protein|nr:hypothetical protein [Acidocella sp.]HQT39510.1 hypothetical protein [Acidocella sp.]
MLFFSRSNVRKALFAIGFMVIGGLTTGTAMAYQGHMFNAMHALQNARQELLEASANKGGYRDRAIDLVNQAIAAVHEGIEVGSHD